MISAGEMAVVDENAAALGVPGKQLMESSGNAVARAVRGVAAPGANVALVCGRGNNGGDALVTARFLDDYDVTVHLLGRAGTIATAIARENWDALLEAGYDAREVRDSRTFSLGSQDVVVDAMLGTGIRGEPREPARSAVEAINASDATVVSVDVPSGVDADTGEASGVAVDADRVVTFHDDKPGLSGLDADVTVAGIGIPAAAERYVERGDLHRIRRDPGSHKGENGEVLVVGGGPYTGAPALAAQSALRAGADLVRVACPESVAREVQGYSADPILRPFPGERFTPDTVDAVAGMAAGHDVVVLGPGLGDADETLEAVAQLLARYEGTAVVDADGAAVVPQVERDGPTVCTPHAGEFRAMAETAGVDPDVPGNDDPDGRAAAAERLAGATGTVVTLKGRVDAVADGRERDPSPARSKPDGMNPRLSHTGCAEMTVGGTGDVLAGATGALAAVLDPFDAACVAVYANGLAGERTADGRATIVASGMLDHLPAVLEAGDE